MTELLRRSGQSIRLGRKIGEGGEGAVYDVESAPNLAAKLYHQPLDEQRTFKITWMAGVRNSKLDGLAAWPVDLLLRRDGRPIGFLMPKLGGYKDIHQLYSPKSRERDFPKADWRFLIHAALNTARAFAVIHETGCVIGDVNHGSVLVAGNAIVSIIDCDSFQVTVDGKNYLCQVGTEDFTPPELLGRPFDGVVRQANHDNFGLAVMIFRLLFMGRHPFAGRPLGKGEMPLPKAMREFRFAYSTTRQAAIQMERPPGTPALAIVGTAVGSLFERAFAAEGARGNRPTGRVWSSALEELGKQTTRCKVNEAHWYLRSLPACPWCAMEAATGASLFGFVFHAPGGTTGFRLDAFWQQVLAVPRPGPLPPLNPVAVTPSPAAVALGRRLKMKKITGPLGAILAVILGLLFLPMPGFWWLLIVLGIAGYNLVRLPFGNEAEVNKLRQARDAAVMRDSQAHEMWRQRAGSEGFDAKVRELEVLKQQLLGVPERRNQKLNQLKAQARALQLARFLDNFEIERASISNIGPGRKQILESYGIETAADLTRSKLDGVPGFGPVLSDHLMAWRRSCEAQFVFNPAQGIDPRDAAKVEAEILALRKTLEEGLWRGLAELKNISMRAQTVRVQMKAAVEKAARDAAQASADYEAANG